MKMQELLVDETTWTRGDYARNANGDKVDSCDASACSWCLVGAAIRCYTSPLATRAAHYKKYMDVIVEIWLYLREHGYNGSMTKYNDDPTTTFADIRRLVEELDI